MSNSQKQFLLVADDQWRLVEHLGGLATAKSLSSQGYIEISKTRESKVIARLTEKGVTEKQRHGG